MKQLKIYIDEKLTLNRQTPVKREYQDEDFPIPTKTKNGDKFQWFKWWEYLMEYGPTSKYDLLTKFELSPTSYSTQFASLSKRNIIIPQKGKLVAILPNEWRT